MGLKDIWERHKEKVAEEKAKEAIQLAETERIRVEVRREMEPELKEIMKERIRQEELAKARVAMEPKDKTAGLKKLADEFKGANLGTNEQMGKLLGGRATNATKGNEKIGTLMSGGLSGKDYGKMMGGGMLRTERDIAGELGRGHKFREDHKNVIGGTPDKDYGKLMGTSQANADEKIKKMVGMKRK
jgi:hypothetical protein